MLYVRFPLSLRTVEDRLHERGIEISHETVRFWWNRFDPLFAARISCSTATPRPPSGVSSLQPEKTRGAARSLRIRLWHMGVRHPPGSAQQESAFGLINHVVA